MWRPWSCEYDNVTMKHAPPAGVSSFLPSLSSVPRLSVFTSGGDSFLTSGCHIHTPAWKYIYMTYTVPESAKHHIICITLCTTDILTYEYNYNYNCRWCQCYCLPWPRPWTLLLVYIQVKPSALPYLQDRQVLAAQRWGRICSTQCTSLM